MSDLITVEELPLWVPGELLLDSAPLRWDGIRIREFQYSGLDVPAPGMHDHLVVSYQTGTTPMNRRCVGDWQHQQVVPGAVSLMTRAVQSHWRWTEDIKVCHIYLPNSTVAKVASDAYEREVRDVAFLDMLRVDDPILGRLASLFIQEARKGGLGGRLYVEALRNQTCVHILRHYADVHFSEAQFQGGLSPTQCRRLTQYIQDNLNQDITLADLARVAELSVYHFTRKFRSQYGSPPHAYVMRKRIERAMHQLANSTIPLKAVAANSGFADQSHMTRLFRKLLHATPAEYRKSRTG